VQNFCEVPGDFKVWHSQSRAPGITGLRKQGEQEFQLRLARKVHGLCMVARKFAAYEPESDDIPPVILKANI